MRIPLTEPPETSDARILIVDDQRAHVRLLEQILRLQGYTNVVSTTDSAAAAGLVREHHPDLVLLDLTMPEPDGFAVMRDIRAGLAGGTYLPILVLTVDVTREVKLLALSAGASDFLTKPFDHVEVVLRARNLLQTRRLHLELSEERLALEEKVRERTRELDAAYGVERESAERLRELDRMKDTLFMAVSHELRTPLTVVLGMSATLERELHRLSDDQIRDFAVRLGGASRKLERLLSGLLDLDRLRRGILEPLRVPTELRPLVDGIVAGMDLRGHPVDVRVQATTVSVDAAQLERILENLLANAVRHTPPGTPIWLAVAEDRNGLLVRVDDAGPGVPGPLKTAIFESFAQGPVPNHAPGLGLGLSLVAQFAQLHGGRAWVEDRPGGGAAFCVRLSPRASSGATQSQQEGASGPAGEGRRAWTPGSFQGAGCA